MKVLWYYTIEPKIAIKYLIWCFWIGLAPYLYNLYDPSVQAFFDLLALFYLSLSICLFLGCPREFSFLKELSRIFVFAAIGNVLDEVMGTATKHSYSEVLLFVGAIVWAVIAILYKKRK